MTPPGRISRKLKYPPPSIFAKPFVHSMDHGSVQLLAEDEQRALIAISRVVEFRRNTVIYPECGRAHFIYNIISGVAETYYLKSSGERRVSSFLFPSDLLGLSEGGEYVATAQALTSLVAYRIPCSDLERLIRRDPKLDVALLCKLCHELRQSERHVLTAVEHDGKARVARFILWLWRSEMPILANDESVTLPMLRQDIADYLELSSESVSRSLSQLETRGLIRRQGPRTLRLLDMLGLQHVAGELSLR